MRNLSERPFQLNGEENLDALHSNINISERFNYYNQAIYEKFNKYQN